MNKNTQANAKKEERRARSLARKLFLSYVVHNPGSIRIIKESDTVFNSVSGFADFILDKDNPKNLEFAQRTASFVEEKSNDLEELSQLLSKHPDALKNVRIPSEMLQLFSSSDNERNNFQIVGKSAHKILDNPDVIASVACLSDFIIKKDTISSFSTHLESQPNVPPLVATIRFIKENPEEAKTFMEFIEQNSSDITRIAKFLQEPENVELSSALGLPKEGHEVVNFLADNSEQIQPAVSMIQDNILTPNLLDTAEDVALFMDKKENQTALSNISNYLSEHESELNTYEGIAKFIENCPQDLHKFSELFNKHTDSIVTLAQIFQNPDNAQYAKMFNINDKDIASVSKTIVDNKDKLQAIAQSANNLLNEENSAVRSSLSEIATFMSNGENVKLIEDFSKYIQIEKEKGVSEPLAFIEYVKKHPEDVSEFLGFVANNNADISNVVSFAQTSENSKLAKSLGLNSDVTGIFSVLDKNANKIEPIASLIKNQILDSDQRDELLDSLYSITEYCTQPESIELFEQIQSGKYNFSSVEGVTSFIDQNYESTKKFIDFIGNNGEKITNISQFVESNSSYLEAMDLNAKEIKNVTSYINKNPENFKNAAKLATQIFEFDKQHKRTRKTITGFITNENNKKSIQNISKTLSKLQSEGIQPFSLEGVEQLLDENKEDLNNVLTFIEKNHEDLTTFGAFLKENTKYASVFGLKEKDAEGMKSFLEILQENSEKIQPAATFTKNLIKFYDEHPNCKEITSFYKQGDNAEQISNVIKKMGEINLNDPVAINEILNDQKVKYILTETARLISTSSEDIVAFADFLSSEENSELVEKLTKGIDGAENTAKSAKNVLQTIKNEQEKLKPVASVLCTALEFDDEYPGIRKSLFEIYQDSGNGVDNLIKDIISEKPSDLMEWIDLAYKHKSVTIKLANWLDSNKDYRKNVGKFIKEHKGDMAKVFGTSSSGLNEIAGYMVDTPGWMEYIIENPEFSLPVLNGVKNYIEVEYRRATNPWNIYSKADIKKTDDPNKPLFPTSDIDDLDKPLLATADMLKKDKERADENFQNIAQSLKEGPKETQEVPTQKPLYAYKKDKFYS